MFIDVLIWGAVVLLFVASLMLLLTTNWRNTLAYLGILYLGVFGLTLIHWTLSMAAVKLVTGWMAATILGITRSALDPQPATAPDQSLPEGNLFRTFATALLVLVAVPAAGPPEGEGDRQHEEDDDGSFEIEEVTDDSQGSGDETIETENK